MLTSFNEWLFEHMNKIVSKKFKTLKNVKMYTDKVYGFEAKLQLRSEVKYGSLGDV